MDYRVVFAPEAGEQLAALYRYIAKVASLKPHSAIPKVLSVTVNRLSYSPKEETNAAIFYLGCVLPIIVKKHLLLLWWMKKKAQ